MTGSSRRTVLMGVGAAGVSAAVAACGSDDKATPRESGESTPAASSPPSESSGAGEALGKVSDVPVGGGVVLAKQSVVLTQPTKGDIKGFSSTCTHRGCTVAEVTDGTINCKCHGSKFSATDGSVKHGPATQPLPAVEVKVDGDQVVRA